MHPRSLFLIFNHTFTYLQQTDARNTLKVVRIVEMPEDLKSLWSNVPPEFPEISNVLHPIRTWVGQNACPNDYVLIQGDFGACYLMVNFAFENDLVPIYSTTSRVVEEDLQPDGSIRLAHQFKHQIFRKYEP